jgi:hypothetical protein
VTAASHGSLEHGRLLDHREFHPFRDDFFAEIGASFAGQIAPISGRAQMKETP